VSVYKWLYIFRPGGVNLDTFNGINTMKLILATIFIAVLMLQTVSAAVVYVSGVSGTESEVSSTNRNEYNGSLYTGDLLEGITATDVSGWFNATRGPDQLVDGTVNGASVGNTAQNSGGNALATFDLGTGDNGLGYDLTSILSIAAWGDSDFDDQVWKLEVAGVGGSPSFSELLSVDYQTASAGGATKVEITGLSGSLTSGVQYVRVTAQANPGGLSNRWLWQELDIVGTSTAIPEPSSLALIGLGGLAFFLRRRK
jgi:hypothetical protein